MTKLVAHFLPLSLILVFGAAPNDARLSEPSEVVGYIDEVAAMGPDTPVKLRGWVCYAGDRDDISVPVHLYFGDKKNTGGQLWKSAVAQRTSDPAVAAACTAKSMTYRFEVPVSEEETKTHEGKSIYVHGTPTHRPVGHLLNKLGRFNLPTRVKGRVDREVLYDDSTVRIFGWACDEDSTESVKIDVYLGGPASNGGVLLKSTVANRRSFHAESTCQQSHQSDFSVQMSTTDTKHHRGEAIYVYAWRGTEPMAPFLLTNSGDIRLPYVI